MIQFREDTVISAKPETIFSIYETVERWCRWEPDVQHASVAGAFVPGTVGRLKPRKGPSVRMRLTRVEKNRSFTDETTLPFCTMRFEHQLIPEGRATRVLHRVSFSGLLAFFFGRVIGNQIKHSLPDALKNLKRRAEKPVEDDKK